MRRRKKATKNQSAPCACSAYGNDFGGLSAALDVELSRIQEKIGTARSAPSLADLAVLAANFPQFARLSGLLAIAHAAGTS